jgi:hypothetical protein
MLADSEGGARSAPVISRRPRRAGSPLPEPLQPEWVAEQDPAEAGHAPLRAQWSGVLAVLGIPIAFAAVASQTQLSVPHRVFLGVAVWLIAACSFWLIAAVVDARIDRFWPDA